MAKRWFVVLLLMMVSVLGGCGNMPPVDPALTVHMLDVGDADCFVITQGDAAMLVDAGTHDCEERIVSYAASLGIERFDIVLLTHPHADHIGAMEQIVMSFDVDRFFYAEAPDELQARTLTHTRLDDALAAKQVERCDVTSGGVFSFGAATVTVYPLTKEYTDLNDYSVVCSLSYDGKRVLFTGDASTERLDDLADAGYDLRADILKISHHGSASALSLRFLDAVSPQYALLSCRGSDRAFHPKDEVMKALDDRQVTAYRTDIHGDVTVSMTHEGIFWKVSR